MLAKGINSSSDVMIIKMVRDSSLIGKDIDNVLCGLYRVFPSLKLRKYQDPFSTWQEELQSVGMGSSVGYAFVRREKPQCEAIRIEFRNRILSITKYEDSIAGSEIEEVLERTFPHRDLTYYVRQGRHETSRWECEYSSGSDLTNSHARTQGVMMTSIQPDEGAKSGSQEGREIFAEEMKRTKLSPKLKALLEKMQETKAEDLALPDAFAEQVREIRTGST